MQLVERGGLPLDDFLFDGQLTRNHRIAAAAIELDNLDRNVLADQRIEIVYRARVGLGIPADRFGLGWDGRMLLAGLAAMIGIVPFVYAALSGYLLVLFCWDFLSGWLHPTVGEPG